MRKIGPWYRLAVTVLRPPLMAFTVRDWRGAENLPRDRGFVVVVNHISHVDPFTFGHFLYDNDVLPRFLVKEGVFRTPFVGRVVTGAEQIPVYRETENAQASYSAAVDAVHRGECIAIYPEGTLTRDPGLWPMRGKTGAARIALATGCPVIPIAQWGAQEILAPYAHRPHLLPRHVSHVWAGPPVDLSAFEGRELTAEVLAEATTTLMAPLTQMVAQMRGEQPPTTVWDPREHDVPRYGNPRAATKTDLKQLRQAKRKQRR